MKKTQGYPVQELEKVTDQTTEQEEVRNLQFGQVRKTDPQSPQPRPEYRKFIIIATAIAGVIMLSLILMVLLVKKSGRGTVEEAAKDYIQYQSQENGRKLMQVTIPSELQSTVSDYTKKVYDLPLDQYMDRMLSEANSGTELRNITVEVGMELTGTDVQEFQESYKKSFNVTPEIEALVRVSVSYEVKGTLRYEYHADWEESGVSLKCFLYKGRWYCY